MAQYHANQRLCRGQVTWDDAGGYETRARLSVGGGGGTQSALAHAHTRARTQTLCRRDGLF